jgi:hypothetical protein
MVYTNLQIFPHFYESKRWFSNVYITLLYFFPSYSFLLLIYIYYISSVNIYLLCSSFDFYNNHEINKIIINIWILMQLILDKTLVFFSKEYKTQQILLKLSTACLEILTRYHFHHLDLQLSITVLPCLVLTHILVS